MIARHQRKKDSKEFMGATGAHDHENCEIANDNSCIATNWLCIGHDVARYGVVELSHLVAGRLAKNYDHLRAS
jgi:hypothetical protein